MALTLIFDLDDTLLPYSPRFHRANQQCARVIADALGGSSPDVAEIKAKGEELDISYIPTLGFDTRRFTRSWVLTYKHFADNAKVPPRWKVVHELIRITTVMHDPPYELLPWAGPVLQCCWRRWYTVHLVTCGLRELQRRKLRYLGIERFFFSSWFGEDGPKSEGIARVLARSPYEPCVMVGDGRKTDIKPALDLGMHAVWFKHGDTWSVFDVELDPKRHYTITSLRQLPAILRSLELLKTATSART